MSPLTKAAMIFWGVFFVAGLFGGGAGALVDLAVQLGPTLGWAILIIVVWLVVAGKR